MTEEYTMTDDQGMRWRLDGSRPISELADQVMEELHTNLEALNTPEPKDQLIARLMKEAEAADPDLPTLASALEYRREEYGLSVEEFMEILGIHNPKHYKAVIEGRCGLSPKARIRAHRIGVPAEVLLQI